MWSIEQTDRFEDWFEELDEADQVAVLTGIFLLEERGPHLPRPHADTINGSAYPNMKELIIQSQGRPIRAFFAFDPKRTGILLCAGHKDGNEKRFYREMIPVADKEYAAHLETLK